MIAPREWRGRVDKVKRILGALLIAGVIAGCSGSPTSALTQPPVADQTEGPTADESVEPDLTVAPLTLPASYKTLTERNWKRLVKAPDKYTGRGYKIWACIYQFDAATGDDGFLAYASYKKQTYWFTEGDNAAFTGDAGKLSDFVEGDIVTMSVAAVGSYAYDTQAGGNTTVPAFQVVTIKRQKGSCD